MTGLDVISLPALAPLELIGLQLHLLDRVAGNSCAPVLLLYRLAGEVVSIGRYHIYDGPPERRDVMAYRRLSGGRIISAGAGWLGCALILPSRAALTADRGFSLKPEQVMNRCVRGALTMLRALGVDCFYPGRDAVTAARRELAMCTFEETPGGALLFELFIAVEQGLDSVPLLLERFDPDGALTCPLHTSEATTTLARELGRRIDFQELEQRMEAGYLSAFGGGSRRDATGKELAAARRRADELAPRWLESRPDPALNLTARASIQLGFVEARLAQNDGIIERIALYGDFIANSAGLEQFERSLAGRRLDLMTLTEAAVQTYGDGVNFILGCGDLTNLTRLILKAS